MSHGLVHPSLGMLDARPRLANTCWPGIAIRVSRNDIGRQILHANNSADSASPVWRCTTTGYDFRMPHRHYR